MNELRLYYDGTDDARALLEHNLGRAGVRWGEHWVEMHQDTPGVTTRPTKLLRPDPDTVEVDPFLRGDWLKLPVDSTLVVTQNVAGVKPGKDPEAEVLRTPLGYWPDGDRE